MIDSPAAAAFTGKALWARRVLLASFWAQILVLTVTTWWMHQEGRQPSVTIWLIRVLPLLFFVPGLLRNNLRSLAWLCFVSLMYFMMAVTEAMSPHRLWINYVEVALSVTVFVSAMLTIRWCSQWQRAQAAANEPGNDQEAGKPGEKV